VRAGVDRSSAAGHTTQSAGHQHPCPRGGKRRHRRATWTQPITTNSREEDPGVKAIIQVAKGLW